MELNDAFAEALRSMRQRRGLTQEDFVMVTSRAYMSLLERGLRCPTIEKVEELASVMQIHPISLIVECYLIRDPDIDLKEIFKMVRTDLKIDLP